MGYNVEEEKRRVYEMLSLSSVEQHHYDKKTLFDESIDIALSEYKDLAVSYDKFFKSVNHLVIFREMVGPKVMQETMDLLKDLRMLIEKNYEKEELDSLPTPVYDQVLSMQKQRAKLLKEIANVYLNQKVNR